mgnify:CR=1 FL=1
MPHAMISTLLALVLRLAEPGSGGTLVFETAEKDDLPEVDGSAFDRADRRAYGGTGVHVLARR